MIGAVSVVAYLMRSFSICLRKKTAGDLVRSGYPSRAIYKTQTLLTSRLDCDFYLCCLEERAAAVPIRCTKAWLRFKGSDRYCLQPFED